MRRSILEYLAIIPAACFVVLFVVALVQWLAALRTDPKVTIVTHDSTLSGNTETYGLYYHGCGWLMGKGTPSDPYWMDDRACKEHYMKVNDRVVVNKGAHKDRHGTVVALPGEHPEYDRYLELKPGHVRVALDGEAGGSAQGGRGGITTNFPVDDVDREPEGL